MSKPKRFLERVEIDGWIHDLFVVDGDQICRPRLVVEIDETGRIGPFSIKTDGSPEGADSAAEDAEK